MATVLEETTEDREFSATQPAAQQTVSDQDVDLTQPTTTPYQQPANSLKFSGVSRPGSTPDSTQLPVLFGERLYIGRVEQSKKANLLLQSTILIVTRTANLSHGLMPPSSAPKAGTSLSTKAPTSHLSTEAASP